ncbi:hypothetical protein L9F63_017994, partial [Diploptera punctata]
VRHSGTSSSGSERARAGSGDTNSLGNIYLHHTLSKCPEMFISLLRLVLVESLPIT